jgi:chloramphenicol-sensitive protein RarD
MNDVAPSSRREGLLYGLAAYGLWGLAPLYFNGLVELTEQHISADEILAHRIVWSVAFLALLLTVSRRWALVAACFRIPALRWTLLLSAVLVGLNWYVYIWSVATQQVLQSSLGYFINPLVNVLLGMAFFREKLRLLQWTAIGLATVGVVSMTATVGGLPWIALSLAGLFGFYGLLRKKTPVDGLVGLSVETFLLAPLATVYLVLLLATGQAALGVWGPAADGMILCSGVATALPLMCFAQAARRLRLSTLGFLQYMSPSLQFLCAVLLGEELRPGMLAAFVWIWSGLAVFTADSLLALRARRG